MPTDEIQNIFKQPKPAPAAVSQYELEQQAIRDNHQRLKAERLARESSASKQTTS
jgi:hypothetical protein